MPRIEDPTGIVAWACGALGLDEVTTRGVTAAREHCRHATGRPIDAWALEFHHDGTGRVDVSVMVTSGRVGDAADPRVRFAGFDLTPGATAVWEYDLDPRTGPRLAGVFHQPVAVTAAPAALAGLGRPLLVSHLTGREGQVRLIHPVPDGASLCRLIEAIRPLGPRDLPLDRLRQARPLVDAGIPVRIGLDYLPRMRRLGPRLGIEVIANPAVVDTGPVLAALGLPPARVAGMRSLADRLPIARIRSRRIPGLPGVDLDRTVDAVGFVHLSVSWSNGPPTLKGYVLVTSLAPDGAPGARDVPGSVDPPTG